MPTQLNPSQFKVGDVVYLKSGSPAMTVEDFFDDGRVQTIWFDGAETKKQGFQPDVLTKDDPHKRPLPRKT